MEKASLPAASLGEEWSGEELGVVRIELSDAASSYQILYAGLGASILAVPKLPLV